MGVRLREERVWRKEWGKVNERGVRKVCGGGGRWVSMSLHGGRLLT